MNYYEVPTQVSFTEATGNHYAGIAYKDEIICGCCGCVFHVSEVEITEEYDWVSLADEIIGV